MKRLTATLATMLALAVVAAPVAAQDRKDLQIFKDVAIQVERYTRYTVFDSIDAAVRDGHVVLSGVVTMPFKRNELEKRVAKVEGVRSLTNEIKVLPVSQFDSELRYLAARAIYGDARFVHYANRANPPIHIVVERGRITLTGVVNNNVERMLARTLVGHLGALSVSNELRTDEEARAALETMN
jgi:hyperosmotically inducible protein